MDVVRRFVWSPWVITSMVLWALDYITTLVCIEVYGMAEGSPFSAWAQGFVGITGYAALLFPVLLLRGVLAAQMNDDGGWRVARVGCRILIAAHVLIVANNTTLMVGHIFGLA